MLDANRPFALRQDPGGGGAGARRTRGPAPHGPRPHGTGATYGSAGATAAVSRLYGLSPYKSSIKFTVRIHSSIMLNATSRSSAFAGSTHSSPGALPGAGFDNGTLVMARNPGFGSGLRPGTGLYCAGKSFFPDGL